MREATAGYVDVENGRLYYEVAGDGPAVVLSHAGVADLSMWDDQFETFAQSYRVIRYDVRGFGRSSRPEREYSHVDDLHRLLHHLDAYDAALIGVSLGGQIVIQFALVHPEVVTALVPVAAGLPDDAAHQDADLRRYWAEEEAALARRDIRRAVELNLRVWVDGPRRKPGQVKASVRDRVRRMQHEIFRRPQPRGRARWPVKEAIPRLKEIAAPTLVIIGGEDQKALISISDLIAREIPGARKVEIRDAAHLPNMEKPEEFNRLVLDFLASAIRSS